jgi:hypothetical protein
MGRRARKMPAPATEAPSGCDTWPMHGAFGTVVVVVSLIALVLALIALARSNGTWSDYGKSGLVMDQDLPGEPPAGSQAAGEEREEEIRSMLRARNERRARRGEPELDVDAELERLTGAGPGAAPGPAAGAAGPGSQIDPELREEIRQLVEARNHRRVRAGKEPLDVEAELAREIERLTRG